MTGPTDRDHAELAGLLARLAGAGYALPGTLLQRRTSCRKPNCRCTADPPALHGPYWQWTRKRHGKTITINLTPDQATRYQPWFSTARDIRDTLTAIEQLSLRIATRDEGWEPENPDLSPAQPAEPAPQRRENAVSLRSGAAARRGLVGSRSSLGTAASGVPRGALAFDVDASFMSLGRVRR
jgi:hypothetical protein